MLTHDALTAPATLALLRTYALDPLVAVRPSQVKGIPRLVEALAGAGLRVGLWPMLDDADGRWASASNAARFTAFAARVADACDAARAPLAELVFDLEPPIAYAHALAARPSPSTILRMAREEAASFDAGRRLLLAAMDDLAARGIAPTSALMPHVLLDGRDGTRWQRALGTPAGLPWRHASVMAYTSMLEGWSRGAVSRRTARVLLGVACRAARARFGAVAGVSLGVVATGALGDEPVYRGPFELAEDVATARAHGMRMLTLFDLGGVLARRPAEAWLDAFVADGAAAASSHVRR